MKVLVLGSGGREHAIAWKLSVSPSVSAVYTAPGNPGCPPVATCLPTPSTTPEAYLDLARQIGADLTVVGPEAPLVDGVYLFTLTVFDRHAARAGIPTARFLTARAPRGVSALGSSPTLS